jgi:hypothetical protein
MKTEQVKLKPVVRIVQDAQQEIKIYLRDAVLHSKSFDEVQKHVTAYVSETINQISGAELRTAVAASFPGYASRIYMMFQRIFGGYTAPQLQAMADMIKGVKIPPESIKDLTLAAPSFVRNAPRITPIQTVQGAQTMSATKLPDTAYNRATPLYTYYKQVHAAVVNELNKIALMEPKPDYASNVSLRNIAEMTVRYEGQMRMIDELKTSGVNLVWIEPHANCSERCEKWQGKLYSLDGTSGKIDGYTYEPLEKAMDIYVTTRAGKVYKNGCITGYNCRHKLTPYKPGNKPVEIPAEVVDRQRNLEMKQRQYERAIRYQRERTGLFQGIDNSIASIARKRAAELNKQYRAYCIGNKLPYMEDRLKVIG